MIQTTRALNVDVEKIGDIGKTEDPLELLYNPADIFLLSNDVIMVCNSKIYNLNYSAFYSFCCPCDIGNPIFY